MQILLVEDDTRLSESLSEALTAQRYVVDLARDGEAAWERLSAFKYDWVLLDVTFADAIQFI